MKYLRLFSVINDFDFDHWSSHQRLASHFSSHAPPANRVVQYFRP